MILKHNIKTNLRKNQRGFLLNPFRFGVAALNNATDGLFNYVTLQLHFNGANGSTTFTDNSGNARVATVFGNAQISTAESKFGGASGLFDGNGDYITFPDSPDFDLTNDNWTMECWVRPTSTSVTSNKIIFAKDQVGGTRGFVLLVAATTGFLTFGMFDGGTNYALTDNINFMSTYLNTWVHIAVVRNGTNIFLYINGVLEVTTAVSTATINSNSSPFSVGVNWGTSSANLPTTESWLGYIDDLRISRGTVRYPNNFFPPTREFSDTPADGFYERTQLLLRFNGANGSTTFTDNSYLNKTATVFGNAQISTAESKFGGSSGYFDGTGDYISFPNTTDWDWATGNGTVECWVRPLVSIPATRQIIFGQLNSAGGAPAFLFVHNNGTGFFRIIIHNGVAFQTIDSLAAPVANTWNHIMITKSGTTLRLHVNGIVQGSITIGNAGVIPPSSEVFTIGRAGAFNGEYFNGYIDDFRWSKAVARQTNTFIPPLYELPITLSDNLYNSTSLLLNMNGTDGSTVFTDTSVNTKTVTPQGACQIDTAFSKFGGASGLFNGTDANLKIPTSTEFGFGTGNFTIEGWVRFTGDAANRCIFDNRNGVGEGIGIYVSLSAANGNNRLSVFGATQLAGTGTTQFAASSNFQHWAVTRASNTLRGFINGVQVWSITDSRTYPSSAACTIGSSNLDSQYFVGNLDDVRVTKNAARYTANFTPPSVELPST